MGAITSRLRSWKTLPVGILALADFLSQQALGTIGAAGHALIIAGFAAGAIALAKKAWRIFGTERVPVVWWIWAVASTIPALSSAWVTVQIDANGGFPQWPLMLVEWLFFSALLGVVLTVIHWLFTLLSSEKQGAEAA